MLRFAYITDTHLGCSSEGYHLQPRYLKYEAQRLLDGLSHWLKRENIDFLIHGGDLTDSGSPEQIRLANDWGKRLSLPTYLCLGNHDLAQKTSIQNWRKADNWLADGKECFAIDCNEVTVIVAGHHWQPDTDFFWSPNAPMQPRLAKAQIQKIEQMLSKASRPVIAVTHAPLNDVAAAIKQNGKPFHPPYEPYLAQWKYLADSYPQLRLALCGHNHAQSRRNHGNFISCTTSAFNEAPAQLRLITVTKKQIDIQTISLAEELGINQKLEPDNAWCANDPDSASLCIDISV